MFGFGSSSSSSASESSSSGTGTASGAAPNREERAQCWTARDAYFTCLDKNGIVAAGAEQGKGPCDQEKKGYEGSCSRSWIEYFNKRRTLELRQKATVDAAAKARDENVANRGR